MNLPKDERCPPILPVILIEFRRSLIVGGRPDGSGLVWILRNAASQRLKYDTSPENGRCRTTLGSPMATIEKAGVARSR
jgi:hypothetical protein